MRPARKPPRWARNATPPVSPRAKVKTLFTNCRTTQNPSTTMAGTGIIRTKKPKITRVQIRARGCSTRYAPRVPETAPLAPTIGMGEAGS